MKQEVAPARGQTQGGFVKPGVPQAPPAEVRQSPTLRACAPQAATRISAFFRTSASPQMHHRTSFASAPDFRTFGFVSDTSSRHNQTSFASAPDFSYLCRIERKLKHI
ncbi:hypothetical protein [uncultured Alistipes sp.]|uniref:hypothetical protein n=1 Tax=uncultured Alistipes sp. TaxID=538949 RepID=UPI0026252A38|nr:hypothetical protein [uncultured Alistipes sp.]